MANMAIIMGYEACNPTDQPNLFNIMCKAQLLSDDPLDPIYQTLPSPFYFDAVFDYTSAVNQIQTAIKNGLITTASAYGFTLTANQIMMVDLIKGN